MSGREISYNIMSLITILVVSECVMANKIIYVDDDGPADYSTIQAAIDDANDGDIILLADGTYTGNGNRDIDFHGKAITLRSIDPNNSTIVAHTFWRLDGSRAAWRRTS